MALGNVKKKAGVKTAPASAGDAINERDLLTLAPGSLAASFVRAKLHDKELAIAGLGAPDEWQGDMPELPSDIAAENHSELSNLLAQFTNALSTATWYAAQAKIEAGYYDDIADYLLSVGVLGSDQSSEQKRTADAKTQSGYLAAKALSRETHAQFTRFSELASTLKLKHATISRVGGFMADDNEASSQNLPRSSSRGLSKRFPG